MDTQNTIINKIFAENKISDFEPDSSQADQNVFLFNKGEQPYVVASFIDHSNVVCDNAAFSLFMQGITKQLPKDSVIELSFIHEGYEEFKKLSVKKNEGFDDGEKAELLETIKQCLKVLDEQESNTIDTGSVTPLLVNVKIPTQDKLRPEESKKFVHVVYDHLKNFLLAGIRPINKAEYAVYHLIY